MHITVPSYRDACKVREETNAHTVRENRDVHRAPLQIITRVDIRRILGLLVRRDNSPKICHFNINLIEWQCIAAENNSQTTWASRLRKHSGFCSVSQ
jgi:hypothetical protein